MPEDQELNKLPARRAYELRALADSSYMRCPFCGCKSAGTHEKDCTIEIAADALEAVAKWRSGEDRPSERVLSERGNNLAARILDRLERELGSNHAEVLAFAEEVPSCDLYYKFPNAAPQAEPRLKDKARNGGCVDSTSETVQPAVAAPTISYDKLEKELSDWLDEGFSIKVLNPEHGTYWRCPHCGMGDYDGHEQSCVIRVMVERIKQLSAPSERDTH